MTFQTTSESDLYNGLWDVGRPQDGQEKSTPHRAQCQGLQGEPIWSAPVKGGPLGAHEGYSREEQAKRNSRALSLCKERCTDGTGDPVLRPMVRCEIFWADPSRVRPRQRTMPKRGTCRCSTGGFHDALQLFHVETHRVRLHRRRGCRRLGRRRPHLGINTERIQPRRPLIARPFRK